MKYRRKTRLFIQRPRRRGLAALAATLLIGAAQISLGLPSAHAFNTSTWDGGGSDANMTTPENWVGDIAPSAGDNLVFATSPQSGVVNDFPNGTAFGTLTVTAPTVISGNDIEFLSTDVDTDTTQISAAVHFHGDVTVNNATFITTDATTIDGDLLVDGGVGVQGSAQFSGAASIGGNVTVTNGGQIHFSSTTSSSIGGDLTVNAYSQLDLHADIDVANLWVSGSVAISDSFQAINAHGTVTIGTGAQFFIATSLVASDPAQLPIITNDGIDAITNTSATLPEGNLESIDSHIYRYGFSGGDGNDLVLTKLAVKEWTDGASDGLISNAANWSDATAPQAGDNLYFPSSVSNITNDTALSFDNIYALANVTYGGNSFDITGTMLISGNQPVFSAPIVGTGQVISYAGQLNGVQTNGTLIVGSDKTRFLSGSYSPLVRVVGILLMYDGVSIDHLQWDAGAVGAVNLSTFSPSSVSIGTGDLDPLPDAPGNPGGTSLYFAITGDSPGEYSQMAFANAPHFGSNAFVSMFGNVDLGLPDFNPADGTELILAQNNSADPIVGKLRSHDTGQLIDECESINVPIATPSVPMYLTYTGGDGNDLALIKGLHGACDPTPPTATTTTTTSTTTTTAPTTTTSSTTTPTTVPPGTTSTTASTTTTTAPTTTTTASTTTSTAPTSSTTSSSTTTTAPTTSTTSSSTTTTAPTTTTTASTTTSTSVSPGTTTTSIASTGANFINAANESVDSLVASPGETITVHGEGFAPNSEVTVTLHSTPVLLGTATTDGLGQFTQTFKIPASVAAGAHHVVLTGKDASQVPRTETLAIQLQRLARTGIDATAEIIVSLSMLFIGAMLCGFGRRRHRRIG